MFRQSVAQIDGRRGNSTLRWYRQYLLGCFVQLEPVNECASGPASPFRAETGQSPAKAVENLRVEAARLLMEQGRHSMDVIAEETGFADSDRMRRAFLRTLGQPPQTIRRYARESAIAP
jgi:hypothetical protein